MDHRNLLKRYIRRVMDSEGCTFIPDAPGERTIGGATTVDFTPEEIAELKSLEAEGEADEAEKRRRFADMIEFLEAAGVMEELREKVRYRWAQVEHEIIYGNPRRAMPMGILSQGKSMIQETLQGARAAVVLVDELVHPREAVAPISLYVPDHPDPYKLIDLEIAGEANIRSRDLPDFVAIHGPMGIRFTAPNEHLDQGNRATRRKRRRGKRR